MKKEQPENFTFYLVNSRIACGTVHLPGLLLIFLPSFMCCPVRDRSNGLLHPFERFYAECSGVRFAIFCLLMHTQIGRCVIGLGFFRGFIITGRRWIEQNWKYYMIIDKAFPSWRDSTSSWEVSEHRKRDRSQRRHSSLLPSAPMPNVCRSPWYFSLLLFLTKQIDTNRKLRKGANILICKNRDWYTLPPSYVTQRKLNDMACWVGFISSHQAGHCPFCI